MNYKIAVIPGDGIGPEIVREAKKGPGCEQEKNMAFLLDYTDLSHGRRVHRRDTVCPSPTRPLKLPKASDAVLMGSIGGDAKTSPWYKLSPDKRPEAGLSEAPQSPESVCQRAAGLPV